MSLYEQVADLPLTVESVEYERRERETTKFTRATTVVSLSGPGEDGDNRGAGEDVTYDADLHLIPDEFDLAGEYTIDSFSETVDSLDLFPGTESAEVDDHFRHYRQWAFESAALDLALRQADTHLGAELGRAYDRVQFVTSPPLGDPPSLDRVAAWRERDPDIEFKLDADDGWTDDLVAELADAGVRVVDLKALYEDSEVAGSANPALYRRVAEAFPDAILEDPAWTDETATALDSARERVSWDFPITGVESVRNLPFEPAWLNIKPSRFGSLSSLLDTIDFCEEHEIQMYGGGQFELGVGRRQLHLLASLCYPDSPNDVAPTEYNDPDPPAELPGSPLSVGEVRGFR
ncbi:hypothetical protein [Halorussus litoreus]|uniref:hypothetical protein n=1 Tax=Halorussus litoreus TaxID=1710536 RepID=UPI000E25809C|nr:hypothetical protein [Halorussus litoreus]